MRSTFLAIAFFSFASTAQAGASFSTDNYGDTYGEIDGQPFSSSTDNYGNTAGEIGGRSFFCSTDNYGDTYCN
jgi:hypothetical protein